MTHIHFLGHTLQACGHSLSGIFAKPLAALRAQGTGSGALVIFSLSFLKTPITVEVHTPT